MYPQTETDPSAAQTKLLFSVIKLNTVAQLIKVGRIDVYSTNILEKYLLEMSRSAQRASKNIWLRLNG